jgi:hypothetical protein
MKPFLLSSAVLCAAVALAESPGDAPTLEKLKAEHTTWTAWWRETVTHTHQRTGVVVVPPSWGHPGAHPWGGVKETRGTYQSAAPKVFSETFKGRLVSYEGNEVKLEHIQRWRKVQGKWKWVDFGEGTFRSSNLSDSDQKFLKKWRKAEKEPVGAMALGQVSSGDEGPFPRPAPDAIAKAEEKIREVYKRDLAEANKPSEKAALAAAFLTAADGVGQDDASRLVLTTMAKDLAVDAEDSRLALRALSALVGRFEPDGPTDPKEQIELGNAPWKEAETAPADKRLGLKVQAAEWYLRAKPAATGFDKTIIEKRLAELVEANPETKPEAKPSDGKKLFEVTYSAGKPRKMFTERIHASSAEDAKQNVLKRYPHARFKKIEEQKVFSVTYRRSNNNKTHTHLIPAATEEEAKNEVRKSDPLATFLRIEEVK